MLKKLYEKNALAFALIWIGVYVVIMSVADGASEALGAEKSVTAVTALALSLVLGLFIRKNGLCSYYNLADTRVKAARFLYYVPVFAIVTVNFLPGFTVEKGFVPLFCGAVSMVCVGFLEEVLFRGLLFRAMEKNGVKSAIIVSSITFGLGHLMNLVNGSGMELLPNLLQVAYAAAAGFAFTAVVYRGGSMWPLIIAHSAINTLSVFTKDASVTLQIISAACLFAVSVLYGIFVLVHVRREQDAA